MHKTLLLILAAVLCLGVRAQEVAWSVDFASVLDNREGDSANDQTIFFTRLSPEVGISMQDGTHRISGGVAWYQPVGNGFDDARFSPTLYYQYNDKSWRISFGMLPRTYLMERAPKFLWSDSISYLQPNIRGFLIQKMHRNGYAEVALDWRQMQTEKQREAFNANLNSKWAPKSGVLYVGERLQYNHLAKQKDAPDGQGVNDDLAFNPFVGVNLGSRVGLDSLDIRVGAILEMERCRVNHGKWQRPAGVLVEATAEWRFLGVKETLYAGDNLLPLYGMFGPELNMGSPYYQAKAYSRTDVYAHIIRNQYIDLEAALNFHATKDVFAMWQQIALHVFIDNQSWKSKESKSQRISNMY